MDGTQGQQHNARATRRVLVACPKCNQGYKIAARLLGRRLICRHCRHEWRASRVTVDELRSSAIHNADSAIVESSSVHDSTLIDRPSSKSGVSSKSSVPSKSSESSSGSPRPTGSSGGLPKAGTNSVAIDTSWSGRQLGRYRVSSILGVGGMGVVWRAHDDVLRRDVALKILNRDRRTGNRASLNTELFMQEARAVAKLQHPSVVSIIEVGEDQGQLFIALEIMEGGTLKEHLDQHGKMTPREVFGHMVGSAKALALAHRRGIIHRDIKPRNLMFDDNGHLQLMDFGLADVDQEAISEALRGKAVGSLGWIAPETARGQPTTFVSDIYSFGLVMFYAMTGRSWFHADSRSEMIQLHQNPPELDLSEIETITPKAEAMMRKCLAVDLEERYSNADELAEDLQECAREDPVAESRQRKTRVSLFVMLVIVAILVGSLVAVLYYLDRLGDSTAIFSKPISQYAAPVDSGGDDPSGRSETEPGGSDSVAVQGDVRPYSSLAEAKVPWPEVAYLLDMSKVKFVGSDHGSAYHRYDSRCGRSIRASNLVTFSTEDEAKGAGRRPCRTCISH